MENCNLCNSIDTVEISVLLEKPALETDYKIPTSEYYRKIMHCNSCDVYFNSYKQGLISDDFYEGFYNSSIDSGIMEERFNRIISLGFDQSDNKQRVRRIYDFVQSYGRNIERLLDVGTGTGVFVFEASKYFKSVYCVDPDKKSIEFVNKRINVQESWVGTLNTIPDSYKFDLITYNKVLEHVKNPIELLAQTGKYLEEEGIIYVELPFAEELIKENKQKERAEFFIEHYTTFTYESFEYLAENSGFKILLMVDLIEPSGKHSIYAFLQK